MAPGMDLLASRECQRKSSSTPTAPSVWKATSRSATRKARLSVWADVPPSACAAAATPKINRSAMDPTARWASSRYAPPAICLLPHRRCNKATAYLFPPPLKGLSTSVRGNTLAALPSYRPISTKSRTTESPDNLRLETNSPVCPPSIELKILSLVQADAAAKASARGEGGHV